MIIFGNTQDYFNLVHKLENSVGRNASEVVCRLATDRTDESRSETKEF